MISMASNTAFRTLLVMTVCLIVPAVQPYNETATVIETAPVFFPRIWEGIIEAGEHVLENARHNVTSNNTCDIQLGIYAEDLSRRETWAVTMYDSTGKQGPGLLDGGVTWHGNFYQCVDLKHQLLGRDGTLKTDYLNGRYCSAMFEVPRWLTEFIRKKDLPFEVPLPSLTVDMCIPSGCHEEDIQRVINSYLVQQRTSTSVNHTLYDVKCHRKISIAGDTAAVISVSVLGFIVACVVFGTLIDAFLVLTTPQVEEMSVQRIGFRKRAGSLLSRAGSIFSRQGSVPSRQGSIFSRQGSILSRRPKIFKRHSKLPMCTKETIIPSLQIGSQEQIFHAPDSEFSASPSPTSSSFQDDVLAYIISHDPPPAKTKFAEERSKTNDVAHAPHSPSATTESAPSKVLDDAEAKAVVMRLKEATTSPAKRTHHVSEHVYAHQTSLEPINEMRNLCSTPPNEVEWKEKCDDKRSVGHVIAELFLCFSIQRNLRRVLGEGSPNYLFCLNGVRVLSITWIVLGNTVSFLYKAPDVVANSVVMAEVCQTFVFQAVINGTFAADTFYILSGTLLAYNWMIADQKDRLKNRKESMTFKKLLRLYFHRFIRIAPCYYVLILTFTNLLPYFGQGPRWKYVSKTIRQCRDHWWANALFISNFYKANDMCMSWTYYLVNDFQFYLISPIILIPLAKYPPIGYVLLSLLVLIQIVSTTVLNNDINGNILRMGGGYFGNVYAKPYCRVGVFAIGIALGYALFKAGRKLYFRKIPLLLGWFLALFTCTLLVFITYSENRVGGVHWTSTQTAVYEALSRPLWGLAVSWIIFCCCIGQGGFIEKFLSWNFFLPLCRITYGIYLLHPLLIVVIVDTSQSLIYISGGDVTLLFVYVLVCAVTSALLLITFVEGPFIRVEKVIRSLVPA